MYFTRKSILDIIFSVLFIISCYFFINTFMGSKSIFKLKQLKVEIGRTNHDIEILLERKNRMLSNIDNLKEHNITIDSSFLQYIAKDCFYKDNINAK